MGAQTGESAGRVSERIVSTTESPLRWTMNASSPLIGCPGSVRYAKSTRTAVHTNSKPAARQRRPRRASCSPRSSEGRDFAPPTLQLREK